LEVGGVANFQQIEKRTLHTNQEDFYSDTFSIQRSLRNFLDFTIDFTSNLEEFSL
jgi:hypothetical protein